MTWESRPFSKYRVFLYLLGLLFYFLFLLFQIKYAVFFYNKNDITVFSFMLLFIILFLLVVMIPSCLWTINKIIKCVVLKVSESKIEIWDRSKKILVRSYAKDELESIKIIYITGWNRRSMSLYSKIVLQNNNGTKSYFFIKPVSELLSDKLLCSVLEEFGFFYFPKEHSYRKLKAGEQKEVMSFMDTLNRLVK